jgi:NADH:ubiquinone oxidoreductase subunit 6 (subunit J)
MSAALVPPALATVALPGGDYVVAGLFLVFVATTVGGGLLAVLTPRIIRSVCGLAMACIGLAGLYYFLNSPFLALMEILIYVGAVCVTIIFAVMLAEPDEPVPERRRKFAWAWMAGAIVVCAGVFWSLARLGVTGDWPTPAVRTHAGTVEEIGVALLREYSVAFEAISLVLLVAILGALAIARIGRHKA